MLPKSSSNSMSNKKILLSGGIYTRPNNILFVVFKFPEVFGTISYEIYADIHNLGQIGVKICYQ